MEYLLASSGRMQTGSILLPPMTNSGALDVHFTLGNFKA